MSEPTTQAFPLRLGSPGDFEIVRRYFSDVGFDHDTIQGVLPFEENGSFDQQDWDASKTQILLARRLAIELFFCGHRALETEFRATCAKDVWEAFCALGLLRPSTVWPGELFSPVRLYPLDGFLVASDRFDDPDGGALAPPDDIVFSALNHLTMRFLRILPGARGGDALDLCGGCGVGALHLARTAASATGADLTARSAFFTDFNARLNGIVVESLCGDLYDPVGNRQFDLITAHPPFIPAFGPRRMIFRDADEFGESIARRIIEGLPARLRPGGTGIVVFGGWDTVTPLEQRALEWLGEAASEFDIVLGEFTRTAIEDVLDNIRSVQTDIDENDVQAFAQNLRAWGAERRIYGALAFRRVAAGLAQAPLRLQMAGDTSGALFQRVQDWRHARCADDVLGRVAAITPRLSPHVELVSRHVVRDGELTLADTLFQISDGIMGKLKLDPWIVPWIARFDGKRSVADIYAAAGAAGALPQGFSLDDFAGVVGLMAERTYLDADPPTPQEYAQMR